ncbi:MAG: hypothetical protein R6X23_07105 [Acidimicrobiia bacterium]
MAVPLPTGISASDRSPQWWLGQVVVWAQVTAFAIIALLHVVRYEPPRWTPAPGFEQTLVEAGLLVIASLPLIVLGVLAVRHPAVAGFFLLVLGGLPILLFNSGNIVPEGRQFWITLVVLPPLVAGAGFVCSSRRVAGGLVFAFGVAALAAAWVAPRWVEEGFVEQEYAVFGVTVALVTVVAGLALLAGRSRRAWAVTAGVAVAAVGVAAGALVFTPGEATSEFEKRLLAAFAGSSTFDEGFDNANCVRVADHDAFHCTMSETSGSTVTAGDRLRVLCDSGVCRFGWPTVGEYGGGWVRVGSFDCNAACSQDVARGYVYELVYEDDGQSVGLGRIESDRDVGSLGLYEDVTTRAGRWANIESVRDSSDPAVAAILVVSFPSHPPYYDDPLWEPTYPPELDIE